MQVLEETNAMELAMFDEPQCEDDHVWLDMDNLHTPPPCDVTATHRLVYTCTQTVTLICRPLADWLGDRAECDEHASEAHTKIVPL